MLQTASRLALALLFGAFLLAAGVGASVAQTAAQTAAPAATRAANPVFTVGQVAVDATADSAANARPIALQEGQRRAFSQLLRRLVVQEEHGRLPQPNEAMLNETVAGFEIDEERTSSTRYLGRITVRFRPDAVRALLQAAKLTYSEARARPLLIIPVWQTAQGTQLWDTENPWREAWKRRGEVESLVPLRLADPAAGRNATATLESLLAAPGRLQAFAEANQAGEALLVSATLAAQEDRAVRIEIYPQFDGSPKTVEALEPFVVGGLGIEQALTTAAEQIAQRIDGGWKRRTRVDFEKPAQLSVAVEFRSLADWVQVRERLGDVALLRRVDVARFSHRDAQLMLDYFGEPPQLAVALAQRGLDLREREGFWELRLAAQQARP